MAAGTVTTSEITYSRIKRVAFSGTAGTAGDAGTASGSTSAPFDGKVIGLATVPGAGGTQPDDNYDVTVTDADGLDLLMGRGANRDETNTEYVAGSLLGAVAGSKLTVNVSAAGASNTGTVYVWID